MASIGDWQKRLSEIYPNNDISADYMMAHCYTTCSDLGRLLLRPERVARREATVIGVVSWLIALANHFDINYEDALLSRFPSVCPYCISKPCICDSTAKQAKHSTGKVYTESERSEELSHKIKSFRNAAVDIDFNWLIDQLSGIYPSNKALLLKGGQGYIVGKLLEEGGELHRAYSDYLRGTGTKVRISVELADLTAWVISCWDLDGIGKDFNAEFANAYSVGCHLCHAHPCVCPPYSITRSQEELIREISAQLRALRGGSQNTPIEDTITLAAKAAAVPSPENKKSLAQSLKQLISLSKGASEGTGAVKQTMENLAPLVEALQDLIPS